MKHNQMLIYSKLKTISILLSFTFITFSSSLAETTTKKETASKDSLDYNTTLDKRCKNVVTAAGKYGESRHPDWGSAFNNNKGASAGFGAVGNYSWYAFGPYAPYGQARWAEDWSGLCNDPNKNKDWFNRLKYIPLNDSGTIWLSLNGNERMRYVYDSQPYLGYTTKKNSNKLLLRSLYGADLHIGKHVRAYAELINAVAGGSNTFAYQTGFQRKRLDLQQGFLELKANFLGAKMGVMGGRQFFVDAPLSMTSPREITNVRNSWDGFRGYAIWDRFRVDLFDFWQTDLTDRRIFGYGPSYNARLYGGYASLALPTFNAFGKKSQLYVDSFFMGYLYNGANASQPTPTIGGWQKGSSRRDNIGGRIYGNVGDINLDITGVYQGGEFRPANNGNSRPVNAFAFNTLLSYTLTNVKGKPTFGLQSDYHSGGNYKKSSGAIHSFASPFFPTASYQDMTLYMNLTNVVSTGPLITYNPTPKSLLKLHAPVMWRAKTNDTIYGIGMNYPLRDNFSGGFVGTMPQFTFAYAIAPHLVLTNDFAGFIGSKSIRNAGAKSGAFVAETLDFRF